MRTTIDIPEDILRQAKAQAALRGLPLKDFVAEAIRMALRGGFDFSSSARQARPSQDQLVLSDDCVFPLITGECGPAMRDLTAEKIHEILEEEDIERAQGVG